MPPCSIFMMITPYFFGLPFVVYSSMVRVSSLRLESAPPLPLHDSFSNRIESHSFSQRKRPWQDKGEPRRVTSDEDLRSQTNGGQSTCRGLICARGPSGCCFGRRSCWQLWASLGRRRDQQEPSFLVCREMDPDGVSRPDPLPSEL